MPCVLFQRFLGFNLANLLLKLAITLIEVLVYEGSHDRLQKIHALGQMHISLVSKIVVHFPFEGPAV